MAAIIAFTPVQAAQRRHRARRRVGLALCVSAAAHAWLLSAPSQPRQWRPQPGFTIEARIEARGAMEADSNFRENAQHPAAIESREARKSSLTQFLDPAPAAGEKQRAAPVVVPVQPDKNEAEMLAAPQIPDPTYYAARDLDVYPRPLAPLGFDFPDRAGRAHAGTQVLLQLAIDEHGTVREVTVIEAAPPGEVAEMARSVVAAARFLPAMRAERAVKSRVLLRINLAPARDEQNTVP